MSYPGGPQSYPGGQQSAFPEELPPRTTISHQKSGFRHCLTLSFLSSYSLRTSDPRTKWRRMAMIITLLVLAVTSILGFVWQLVQLKIVTGVVFAVIDVLFIWSIGWSLAIIGDAPGTRRICGVDFGRLFFDIFIFVCFVLYTLFFILGAVSLGLIAFEGAWLGIGVLIFIVAWIATLPPVYPQGVV